MCQMKKRANLVQIRCEKEILKKSKVYPQLLKLHKKTAARDQSCIKQNPVNFTNKSSPDFTETNLFKKNSKILLQMPVGKLNNLYLPCFMQLWCQHMNFSTISLETRKGIAFLLSLAVWIVEF